MRSVYPNTYALARSRATASELSRVPSAFELLVVGRPAGCCFQAEAALRGRIAGRPDAGERRRASR
jgi:hypothetical protein